MHLIERIDDDECMIHCIQASGESLPATMIQPQQLTHYLITVNEIGPILGKALLMKIQIPITDIKLDEVVLCDVVV